MLQGRLEYAWRNGKVEQSVALFLWTARLDLPELGADRFVRGVLGEISVSVEHPVRQPLPDVVVHAMDLVGLVHLLAHDLPVRFVGARLARHSEQGEMLRQQLVLGEIVDRRQELSSREIARPAENHHRARVGNLALPGYTRGANHRKRLRSLHAFFTA